MEPKKREFDRIETMEDLFAKCKGEELVEFARLAEQAERYDEMAMAMKRKTETDTRLSADGRNLLSVAYKNMVGARRSSWRVISTIEAKAEDSASKREICRQAREKVEKELQFVCDEVLNLLEKYLLNDSLPEEEQVFYLKMKGDYLRYIAEFKEGVSEKERECPDKSKARDDAIQQSEDAYNKATGLVKTNLGAAHPNRLGLALNFSVFFYEIKKEPQQACKHAKEAFDEAMKAIECEQTSMDPDKYKDSTLIMQLLRDNLSLWTSDTSAENDGEAQDLIE